MVTIQPRGMLILPAAVSAVQNRSNLFIYNDVRFIIAMLDEKRGFTAVNVSREATCERLVIISV
jgi:hypothetical protein